LVVYDEIDIPFAQLRMRKLGGAAGHNGMRSIFAKLGSQEFPRLRVGVGRPPGRKAVHSHVLDDFTMTEKPQLEMMIDKSVEGIEIWLREGIDMAMNRINVTV
jgi:PTH1 family peptidyl-tRNA hydrolase